VHRSKRFLCAVGSGYAAVVATSLQAFVSIPIALSYLVMVGFGVAAVIIQIGAFTQVLQFGVGPCVARFIVNYNNAGDADRTGLFVQMVFCNSCAHGMLYAFGDRSVLEKNPRASNLVDADIPNA